MSVAFNRSTMVLGVRGDVKEDAEGAGAAVYIKMQDGRD
jgi:hypothetical protein